jgi:hypothetical protein
MPGEITKIEEVAYHRNGVGGVGFHVVNFRWREEDDPPTTTHNMMGVCFELEGESEKLAEEGKFYNPPTAVFNRDLLALDDISFGSNSYRGDVFDKPLREAIKAYDERPY